MGISAFPRCLMAFYTTCRSLQSIAFNRTESRKFRESPITKMEDSVLARTLIVHMNGRA
jgi:hypothetical protein